MIELDKIEVQRIKVQHQLEQLRTQSERNKLGQFATPAKLAQEILEFARSMLAPDVPIRFIDPTFGTGAFYSSLLKVFPPSQIAEARGFEIDTVYGYKAGELWQEHNLNLQLMDFTTMIPSMSGEKKSNLLICNPPYIRHHHLSKAEKQRLQARSEQVVGIKLSQQTGLYGYFLCLAHAWLAENGLGGWLIPGEFMDVNYGQGIREYLQTKVTLLRIHRFDPEHTQFHNALVSSAIVWFRISSPPIDHKVEFTYGGTLTHPATATNIDVKELSGTIKWNRLFLLPIIQNTTVQISNSEKYKNTVSSGTQATSVNAKKLTLSNLFDIKRGLATGANSFFILDSNKVSQYQIPTEFLYPILPNARYLPHSEVYADEHGNPVTSQNLFLLACNLPEKDVEANYPLLWEYLQMGVAEGVHNRFLCSNRKPWYAQEKRLPSMFICTYMGRQNPKRETPFRFILNHSKALVTNSYLILYPKPMLAEVLNNQPEMAKLIWQGLTSISAKTLIEEGRVYGGGLHKVEPKELGNIPVGSIFSFLHNHLIST